MGHFRKVLVVGLIIFLSASAFAAVQSVRVGGDVNLRQFTRWGFPDTDSALANAVTDGYHNMDNFVTTLIRLKIDADLTEKVSAHIRLASESDWGVRDNRRAGLKSIEYRRNYEAQDLFVDLGYITLEELFWRPLTVVIGRQHLWYGRGFIIGANTYGLDYQDVMSANEFSTNTAFDAARAILDFSPWTIDLVYSTICNRGKPTTRQQGNLWGLNLNYQLEEYNAVVEGYYWFYRYDAGEGTRRFDTWDKVFDKWNSYVYLTRLYPRREVQDLPEERTTHVVGARIEAEPTENITFYAEAAYEWGKYCPADLTYMKAAPNVQDVVTPPGAAGGANGNWTENLVGSRIRRRQAWAWDVGIEFRFPDVIAQPRLGAEVILYSGDKEPWSSTSVYKGWDKFFRGKFDTAIREFMGWIYPTRDLYDPPSWTNEYQFAGEATIRPFDTFEVHVRYTYFMLHHKIKQGPLDPSTNQLSIQHRAQPPTNRRRGLGQEIDIKVTQDYTEDVQLTMLIAIFLPGKYYKDATGYPMLFNTNAQHVEYTTTYPTTDTERADPLSKKRMIEMVSGVRLSF